MNGGCRPYWISFMCPTRSMNCGPLEQSPANSTTTGGRGLVSAGRPVVIPSSGARDMPSRFASDGMAGTRAMSRNVGKRSMSETAFRTTKPCRTPGPATISGTLAEGSYMLIFSTRRCSRCISPWSDVKTKNVLAAVAPPPAWSSAPSTWPTMASTSATCPWYANASSCASVPFHTFGTPSAVDAYASAGCCTTEYVRSVASSDAASASESTAASHVALLL
mmetsp:Transcript_18478/g.48224  ORF Transcript_18478/g.48224 Transcript_18478/m.48224 type:complete len:221 (-) Transcript_18478:16-678(-)